MLRRISVIAWNSGSALASLRQVQKAPQSHGLGH